MYPRKKSRMLNKYLFVFIEEKSLRLNNSVTCNKSTKLHINNIQYFTVYMEAKKLFFFRAFY